SVPETVLQITSRLMGRPTETVQGIEARPACPTVPAGLRHPSRPTPAESPRRPSRTAARGTEPGSSGRRTASLAGPRTRRRRAGGVERTRSRASGAGDKTFPGRPQRRLGAGRQVELGQHVADVGPRGAFADPQGAGDVPVRLALRDQDEDLALPRGERGGR